MQKLTKLKMQQRRRQGSRKVKEMHKLKLEKAHLKLTNQKQEDHRMNVNVENTNHKRKYYCLAGLQLNKIGFDQKRNYVVISMYRCNLDQTCKTGDQLYNDSSPNGECCLV